MTDRTPTRPCSPALLQVARKSAGLPHDELVTDSRGHTVDLLAEPWSRHKPGEETVRIQATCHACGVVEVEVSAAEFLRRRGAGGWVERAEPESGSPDRVSKQALRCGSQGGLGLLLAIWVPLIVLALLAGWMCGGGTGT
jgi:hypothetical protein